MGNGFQLALGLGHVPWTTYAGQGILVVVTAFSHGISFAFEMHPEIVPLIVLLASALFVEGKCLLTSK